MFASPAVTSGDVRAWLLRHVIVSAMTSVLLAGLSACGGGGGYGGGGSGGMSSGGSGSGAGSGGGSPMALSLTPNQIYPVPTTTATASANLLIDATTGASSGNVTLSGVTATAVTINDAYAGNTGSVVLTLTQSTSNANVWNVANAAVLTTTQLTDFLAGKLYAIVTSSAYPNGELRGQIVPTNITITFAPMGGIQESPAVTTTASGVAAVTVNSTAKTAAVNINTTGVDTASGADIRASITGGNNLLAVLVADNSTTGRWLNENIALNDADLANFTSSRWFVNVYTPTHLSGEIRGQFAPNAPTLATLQANIFTPLCSGCHTGVGSTLPGVQNLTTADNTFAAVVNVASLEKASLVRIRPYDPDDSYLVHKIEGDSTITGSRMPLGGQLTQAQIDQIRAWTAAGALNN